MIKAKLSVFTFVLILLATLSSFAQKLGSNGDYQIYNTVIDKMFAGGKVTFDTQVKVKQLVIRNNTNSDYAWSEKTENWEQLKLRLKGLSDETIANYESKVKTVTEFQQNFDIALQYVFLDDKKFIEIFPTNHVQEGDHWPQFYEKYPDSGGHIGLSNVGYNKAGDQALVYFVHWCETLCGSGYYFSLKKVENKWQIDTAAGVWMS